MLQQLHLHARRQDPTRTVVLRKQFEREVSRRIRGIQRAILDGVGHNNALVLNMPAPMPRFQFPTSASKVEAFMRWLRQAEEQEILGTFVGTSIGSSARQAWQNVYIRTAYQKGLAQAANNLNASGGDVSQRFIDASFFRPIHADAVGLLFTRTFSELDGITRAMDQALSRVLAQGMAEGLGPMRIARNITHQIDKIGIARARMLARTEIIRAHAEATLNMYTEAQVNGVSLLSEFSTAGDDAVCEQCEELEGRTYTIAQARGVIPVHPNCRCAWLPVIEGGWKVVLQ